MLMAVKGKVKFKLVHNCGINALEHIIVIVNRMMTRAVNIMMKKSDSPFCVGVCKYCPFRQRMTFKDICVRRIENNKEHIAIPEPIRRSRLAGGNKLRVGIIHIVLICRALVVMIAYGRSHRKIAQCLG